MAQDRQAALERQVSQYVEQDAVIQPELPARCLPPLFSGGDIYSKRFVRLSRPPAGMSMLPVCAPRSWCGCHACASDARPPGHWAPAASGAVSAGSGQRFWSDTVTWLHNILFRTNAQHVVNHSLHHRQMFDAAVLWNAGASARTGVVTAGSSAVRCGGRCDSNAERRA